MESEKFEPGDVVTLRSEPQQRMTVERTYEGNVVCIWFDPYNALQRGTFTAPVLTHYVPRGLPHVPQPRG